MNHKTVVFNEAKMNFDGNLDFSVLSSEVVTYSDTTPDQFLERVADAEILVTKEMPVSREQILALPDSVKLICEAGTGYNNLIWMQRGKRELLYAISRLTVRSV